MTLLNDCPFLLLVGRRRLTVDDDDSNWLDPELDSESTVDGGDSADSSSDGSGDDESDGDEDSDDGDSSIEAILAPVAEAVQRLQEVLDERPGSPVGAGGRPIPGEE